MRITGVLQKIGDVSKKFSNLPDAYIKRSMEQVRQNVYTVRVLLSYQQILTGLLENTPRETTIPAAHR